MRFHTEFLVLHRDTPLPSEDHFCPFIWQAMEQGDYFDSDGDYYFNWPAEQKDFWSDLSLKYQRGGEYISVFDFRVWRGEPSDSYETGAAVHRALSANFPPYHQQHQPFAVSSLCFTTSEPEHYRAFLQTVHFYLDYMQGELLNDAGQDAKAFAQDYL